MRQPINACSLLTSDDIRSVQGEPVQETKPSRSSGVAFYAAGCYFATPTNTNSVVVTVTQRAQGAGGKDPKKWWAEKFHHEEGEEHASEREEESGTPPSKVGGIGDEAFWVSAKVGGALYVLKGDVYLRVSTGGEDQLEKTKRLAELALKHL